MASHGSGTTGRALRRGALALASVLAVGALVASGASADSTHAYRHGQVPRVGAAAPASQASAGNAGRSRNLSFGGGLDGVGVTTGAPKVYLVFYGSQWGTQAGSYPNFTYSGDSNGTAPDLEKFFTGLGTGGELWSGVMTQYCEGVATGATTCPSSSILHVGYPTGGALAGVWEDTSATPLTTTAHQLAAEALAASAHFGNTSAAANRDAQYFIVSPHGSNPDNYLNSNFCAWHDFTGDSTLDGGGAVNSSYAVAFTNMPYVTDVGASCGEDFVNPAPSGTLDGVTIVGGHEYAETITDQFPAGGWLNSQGYETGDLCAWISSGQGASQNITLGTAGTFAVQSTWANDFQSGAGGCEVSHAIVTNGGGGGGGNTVSVTNPGNQSTRVNQRVTLQIHASDSASSTLTYAATPLPSGLSVNASTGVISGTPTKVGTTTVQVTVTDTTGASGNVSFSWTVTKH